MQAELPNPAESIDDENEVELTEADFPQLSKIVGRLGQLHQGVSKVADDEGQMAALASLPEMQKQLFDFDEV